MITGVDCFGTISVAVMATCHHGEGIAMNVSRTITPSDSLRAAVLTDGRPLRRIAGQAKLPPSSITRFIRRQRGLSSAAFDRVAAVVGLEFRPPARSA